MTERRTTKIAGNGRDKDKKEGNVTKGERKRLRKETGRERGKCQRGAEIERQ